ncbi:hypothetical protein SO802_001170 [Lithocarpus litseifolius]|uniref:Uncharacterized protein n=1 Tax=Lithocarpus litseifolius TaxID=425828 RepID=A0AAW2DYT9_9ROSI
MASPLPFKVQVAMNPDGPSPRRVQIFNFLRLVTLPSKFGCGMDNYFQFEAKPSGASDHTLKTFEGSVYEQFFPTQTSWPVTCRLVGPNSQRYVPPAVAKFTWPLNEVYSTSL